ncbi:MAG: hypothetical protein QM757_05735 [Paludibaculum sp.]
MAKIEWNRQPTYEDANLLLRLYEERREEKLRKARAWFVSECKYKTVEDWQKLCPPGSEMNAYYRMVTTYWEMQFRRRRRSQSRTVHSERARCCSDSLSCFPINLSNT